MSLLRYGAILPPRAAGGAATIHGDAALTGTGSLTSAGHRTRIGAAALTGAGSSTAAGSYTRVGRAALTGTGTSTAAGTVTHIGSAALTGTGSLTATASGVVVEPPGGPILPPLRLPARPEPKKRQPKRLHAEVHLFASTYLTATGRVTAYRHTVHGRNEATLKALAVLELV